jgi:hypothetical protein
LTSHLDRSARPFTFPGPTRQDHPLRPERPIAHQVVNFAAVYGEVGALAERARAHGGGRVEGPADTPWNTRDLTTTDPDGNVVIFTAARPPELTDHAFSGQMRRWSSEQGVTAR